MSDIRQCDRHKGFFKKGEVGSSRFTGVIVQEYQDGGEYEEHQTVDFCADCTKIILGRFPKGSVDPLKIEAMEIENGIPVSGTGMPTTENSGNTPTDMGR